MARTIVAALVALVVSVAAGAALMNMRSLALLEEQRSTAAEERASASNEVDKARVRVDKLSALCKDYERQLEDLERPVEEAPVATVSREEPDEADADWDALADLLEEEGVSEEGRDEDEERRAQEWEERRERFREFAGQMRQGVRVYLDEEMQRTKDPVTRDRLAAMGEYSDYLFDLRSQMHQAETDEERDALREDMHTAWGEAGELMQAQREHMVQQFAESQGINDPTKQEQFAQSMREMMQSPFFQRNPMMGGGGPGMGGGPGRGGGPPRGGGRGR